MNFDPPLKKAYLEAVRYLEGAPTPYAERLMRIRNNAPKPNKGSYRYKDSVTGLTFNGTKEIVQFFGCTNSSIRHYSPLKDRLKIVGLIDKNETKARRVKYLPTGRIYESINDAIELSGVKKTELLNHLYGRGGVIKRQWRYA